MISSIAILVLSTALFLFYVQTLCENVLRREFRRAYSRDVLNAIDLEFPRLRQAVDANVEVSLAQIRVALKGSLFDREKQIIPGQRRRFIGRAEEVASDIRDYRSVGVDTMIFDVRRPSMTETLERMEWMAKEVFPQV